MNELENKADETATQSDSTEKTNEELNQKADDTASQSSDDKTNIELEEERQRREGAEKKIVELKRKLKDAGVEETPDVNEVVEEALNRRIDALKAITSQNEAKLAKENSELRTALKAKGAQSNSSQGSNQDKPESTTKLPLSSRDKAFMKRFNLTEEDIRKSL